MASKTTLPLYNPIAPTNMSTRVIIWWFSRYELEIYRLHNSWPRLKFKQPQTELLNGKLGSAPSFDGQQAEPQQSCAWHPHGKATPCLINTNRTENRSWSRQHSCASRMQVRTKITISEQNTWQNLFLSHILASCSNGKHQVVKFRWQMYTALSLEFLNHHFKYMFFLVNLN